MQELKSRSNTAKKQESKPRTATPNAAKKPDSSPGTAKDSVIPKTESNLTSTATADTEKDVKLNQPEGLEKRLVESKELKVCQNVEYDRAVSYLKEFVKALENKSIFVSNNTNFVSLNPADELSLEIKAKKKKNKQKFELSASWYNISPDENTQEVEISSKKPE